MVYFHLKYGIVKTFEEQIAVADVNVNSIQFMVTNYGIT